MNNVVIVLGTSPRFIVELFHEFIAKTNRIIVNHFTGSDTQTGKGECVNVISVENVKLKN